MNPKRRARTERRADARAREKIAEAREKVFALEPGGSSRRPIDLASASLVETHARATHCPRCDATELEVLEHLARIVDGVRLREACVRCRTCGSRRSVWFRLIGLNQLN